MKTVYALMVGGAFLVMLTSGGHAKPVHGEGESKFQYYLRLSGNRQTDRPDKNYVIINAMMLVFIAENIDCSSTKTLSMKQITMIIQPHR